MDLNSIVPPELIADAIAVRLLADASFRSSVIASAATQIRYEFEHQCAADINERSKRFRDAVDKGLLFAENAIKARIKDREEAMQQQVNVRFDAIQRGLEATAERLLAGDAGAAIIIRQVKELIGSKYGREISKLCKLGFANMTKMILATNLLDEDPE